jgi:hypothetical protein
MVDLVPDQARRRSSRVFGCSVWVKGGAPSTDTNDPDVLLDPHLHDPNPITHSERLGSGRQLPVEHRHTVFPRDVVNLRGQVETDMHAGPPSLSSGTKLTTVPSR